VTVMAAEAATGVGSTVAEGGSARAAAARGGTAHPRPGPPGPAGPSGRQQRQPRQQQQRRSQPVTSKIPRKKISRTNYQPVILMEFVAAILLTAMTPIATRKDSQGLSPYAGADIVKLSAITLVYLLLAMVSVGGRGAGRMAAWLGGLILLTDGLYEASNIAKDLQIFGGGGKAKPKAGPGAGGDALADAGQAATGAFGQSAAGG